MARHGMIRVVETRANRNTERGEPEGGPERAGPPDGRGHAERTARGGGRRPGRRGAVRAHRRPRGLPGGSLRPQARHDLGRGDPPHAQAEGHAVHHRNRRALPQARDLRRGGDDRDVPGGCLDAQDRGRERDPLGFQRVRVHRVQPQREGIRGGGGVAQPAPRARLPLRLRGRHLPEAQLGRLLRERGRYGGHRGERRRIQGGDRRRRGLPGSGRGA